MLQMIFQSDEYFHHDYDEYFHDDYDNHYLYQRQNQRQNQIQNQRQNQRQNQIQIKNNDHHVKNETDEDWGFYVDFDPPTPPKHVFPKKNNNPYLANPVYNYETTQQKNVNYLPKIQEEDQEDQFILEMDLPPHSPDNNDKTHNDYKKKISQNIFSGLTICALTTASIYFYNKIRSY